MNFKIGVFLIVCESLDMEAASCQISRPQHFINGIYSIFILIPFQPIMGQNANFRHFSPFLTKNCTSIFQKGLYFIENHTRNRLKVVPKAKFDVFTTKIPENAKNQYFHPIFDAKMTSYYAIISPGLIGFAQKLTYELHSGVCIISIPHNLHTI